MLDWENASPLYKGVVLSGMAFLAVGLILSLTANLAHITWLLYASMAIIGVGLVTHLVGLGIRSRDARRRARERAGKEGG
ncbi:hypothetical protein SPF06_02305 [Sinomonas sp. JGH33]|uniref:DUF3188 domain-containing protein n=1 Tax=Sinomonas terricola TaxID=3110330 RepID=A0ABU5T312_9MICC|nr:hypothetical protein [Sinomonas sp. JGH33]MEA5453546.1 hypothetical protein [Sinomonas sp. JGH33]